jgi:hypothetical protein
MFPVASDCPPAESCWLYESNVFNLWAHKSNGGKIEIKNYISERYPTMSGSLPDILAVRAGIKPVARLSCNKEHFQGMKDFFAKKNLGLGISEKPFGSQYYLYLSASEELIEKARAADNSFRYHEMSREKMSRSIREFGALLGYPKCCTDFFVEKMQMLGRDLPGKFIPDKRIDFRFNNLLNGVSNHFLSFHEPCSYTCQASESYLKRIYGAVCEKEPGFGKELDRYLKAPYLVVFNLDLHMSEAWDRRMGFYFDGEADGSIISYRKSVFFRTRFPEYEKGVRDKYIERLKQTVARGNRIECGEKSVSVYRDKRLLGNFEKRESLHISLFDFA